MTCCKKNENGLTLEQNNGLSLGSSTGPFSWPYAACSSKVTDTGIVIPLDIHEAFDVCVKFCKTRKQISGDDPVSREFEKISGLTGATTGIQQCELIRDIYLERLEQKKTRIIEEFTPTELKSEPFWILPIILISSIVLSLLILRK
jgi:phage host-nuclease inhibitor protein Gam